ncbi:neprilysin-1 [Orussus abietinus]|uniref:neprilysin-1 n=1 Tax=Orussus abietinus TaxID=222816 RepID=UPI000625AEE7|nr:neprilysin-1 [Orussus abietinus]
MNDLHKSSEASSFPPVETSSVYSLGSRASLVPVKSRDTYFKKRKQARCFLPAVLAVPMIALLAAVVVLSVLVGRFGRRPRLCDTEECVRIAASLKESMDASADPCEDFYEFVCGRWPREHPTPDSRSTNSWFSVRADRTSRIVRDLLRRESNATEVPWAVRQAKKLYDSCVDIDSINSLGLQPIVALLGELGLPLVPAAFTDETGNYVELLAKVKRVLGRDVFFGSDIIPDPRNGSRNVIVLGPPTTDSPLPSDRELDKRAERAKGHAREAEEDEPSAERVYMTEVIKEVLGNGTYDVCRANRSGSFPLDEDVEKVVDEIYALSERMYLMFRNSDNETSEEESLGDEDYALADELQRSTDAYVAEANSSLTPATIWRPFLEELLDGTPNLDLSRRDKVLIGDLQYLQDVALILSSTDKRTLETMIWWVVVDILVPHSSANLRRAWSRYVSRLTDVEVGEPRSLQCANSVNDLMGMAVSWLFVEPTFREEKGPKVSEMLEDIRAAFASLVVDADWMDGRTKLATLEKNQKMTSAIGYPEWLFLEGRIDQYYGNISLSEETYLANMLQIVRQRSREDLSNLRAENLANETYWVTEPTDVNAFHTFQANQITVPVGILQFPFYDLGLEALNYGAIGTILGHELTHGFDNSGRHYDGDGNLRQWWSNDTVLEYTERTRCFVEHYGSYYEKEVGLYVDGELTLGENIADNGGLREALLAYGRWLARHGSEPLLPGFADLTHEQLFFVAFGHLWCEDYTPTSIPWMLLDPHCPGHVRLLGVLRNSKEFSQAWKCPAGSGMNPVDKCRLW